MGELPRQADCIVVGGGIVGVATALELQRAGVSVLLLEHGALGNGVSGASLAALAAHALARIEDLPVIAAAGRRWAQLAEELDDIEYRRQGQLRLIADPEEVPSFAALVDEHRALGAPLELLDADRLREVAPGLGPDAACAAVLSPDDASVQALRAVHAVAGAATRLGVEIRCGVAVTAISDDAGGVEVTTADGQRIAADRVVLAAGPWTAGLATGLGAVLPLEARRARCAITSVLPPVLAQIASGVEIGGGLGIGEGYFQIQQTRTGQLLFNTVVDGAIGDSGWWGPGVDDAFLVASSRTLARVVPASAEARLMRSWAAVEAWTPDRRFLCGPLDGHPRVLVAAGDSGSGFLRAPLLGSLIADHVLGREPEVDPAQFAPDRFAATA